MGAVEIGGDTVGAVETSVGGVALLGAVATRPQTTIKTIQTINKIIIIKAKVNRTPATLTIINHTRKAKSMLIYLVMHHGRARSTGKKVARHRTVVIRWFVSGSMS